jgi:hypothetical protein
MCLEPDPSLSCPVQMTRMLCTAQMPNCAARIYAAICFIRSAHHSRVQCSRRTIVSKWCCACCACKYPNWHRAPACITRLGLEHAYGIKTPSHAPRQLGFQP